MSENNSENSKNKMERGLKNRHVQIIAIAGTIGTGLFLGAFDQSDRTIYYSYLYVDGCLYVFNDAGDWRNVVL